MRKIIKKVWESPVKGSKPYIEVNPITPSDFDFDDKKFHQPQYNTILHQITCTLKDEVIEELKSVGMNIERPYKIFSLRAKYDFRGCRTDEHRQDKITKARKEVEEKFTSFLDYKTRAAEYWNKELDRFVGFSNEDYTSNLMYYTRERVWDFSKNEEINAYKQQIDELQKKIKELDSKIDEIKRKEVNEYLDEQGKGKLFDTEIPSEPYKQFVDKVKDGLERRKLIIQ